MIPVVYLLHLLEFNRNSIVEVKPADYIRTPFTYSLLIIIGTTLLIYSELSYKQTSEIKKVVGVLVTFGTILCGVLYSLIFTSKFSKVLSLITTFVLYVILAVAMVNGSENNDEEVMKVCLFFGAAIPATLISTSIYFRYDISSELKNSLFLGLWTLLFIPSMSLMSDDYLIREYKFFCNVVNFSFLALAFYCLILETFSRFQQIEDRENKNVIIMCFVALPLGIAAAFFSFNRLPSGLLIAFVVISLTIVFTIALFYLPIKILVQLTLRLSSKTSESILWYEDILVLMFSILWKLLYILSIGFLSRKVYFFDFKDKIQDYWIVSQGLIILLSAMGHSAALENVNFFVQEINHDYPSVRKISVVSQVVPSLLRESFEPLKKKWQIAILILFILIEIISLACISASKTMYFLVIANVVTAVFFIVAFETKLKTWNKGNKISAEFLVFIWTCIYIPCVCGSSVISTTAIAGKIDPTSSMIIFFIIISFCIQLGLFSGELYDKISSVNYVCMNLALRNRGYSMNYRNLIIEDYNNKNTKNFEIIQKGGQSFDEYVKEHFSFVCRKCRLGEDHDIPGLYYEANHYELRRILLLQPVFDKVFEPEPEEEEVEPEVPVEKPPERLDINNVKMVSYREFFNMSKGDVFVKKFDFVNNLADVYRTQIDKGQIDRNDFFIIFLEITHDVSKQVLLKFDSVFVKKVLRGLARLIYKNIDEQTMIKVEKDLLTKPIVPPAPAAPIIKQENFVMIQPKKHVAAQVSKAYLTVNVSTKNIIDSLIPYNLVNLSENLQDKKFENIKALLDELNQEPNEAQGESIESVNLSIQLLFFASIFNMYSLTSVALTSEINWLKTKLSLSSGIIPSESSWIVSVILSFSLIFIFLVMTFVLFLLIKYKKNSPRMIQWGKSFMIMIASGLLVENLIFLLSNLICESTNGNLHLQNNVDIDCMSRDHVALLSVSVILFVVYFFLVQVFYPSFYKLSTRIESYFNVEVHCKVIYSAIASCISNELLGFKLVLCLCLGVTLVVYSFYRIRVGGCNTEKFRDDIKEYLVVVWIYIWAILLYNKVVTSDGFIVLIVTIAVYSVYGQRKFFWWLLKLVRRPCEKNESPVVPVSDETQRLNDLDKTQIKSPGLDSTKSGNSSFSSSKRGAAKSLGKQGKQGKLGKGSAGKAGAAKTGNRSSGDIRVDEI